MSSKITLLKQTVYKHLPCDRACESQPSEHKLHLGISLVLKRVAGCLALKDSTLNSAFAVENLCG